jgi:hypothetical protein
MFTTCRRTSATALSLLATATLAVALTTPAAHAQREDTAYGPAHHGPTDPSDIGAVVAFRKAQYAQYVVDEGLVAYR